MFIKDRQATVQLQLDQGQYRFFYEGKDYQLSSLERVHRFFLEKGDLDTVKICQEGKKHYVHFFEREIKTYVEKRALRRALSQESGGAWYEVNGGRERSFSEKQGWLGTSIKEVTDQTDFQDSILKKVAGFALGLLAFSRNGRVMASSLLSLQNTHSLLGVSLMSFSHGVDAEPAGMEFEVNANSTQLFSTPHVFALSDGGFIALWTGFDEDQEGIFGKRYSSSGEVIAESFQINRNAAGSQSTPYGTSFSDGGFVVVWSEFTEGNSYAQLFGQNNSFIGNATQINTFSSGIQHFPQAAVMIDSHFIVTWQSTPGQDGDSGGIYAQILHRNGSFFGTEFRVNNYTIGNQLYQRVASLPNGQFVIIWSSDGQDGDRNGVYGQIFEGGGRLFGQEFRLNSETIHQQYAESIIGLLDNSFIGFWSSYNQDGDLYGVYGQRYDSNGSSVDGEFRVNTYTLEQQQGSSAARLVEERYVVVWASGNIQGSGQDGDLFGVYGQLFFYNGTKIGDEFRVNNYTQGSQSSPSVTALEDGGFVVVWTSEGQGGNGIGVYGQRFDLDGQPIPLQIMGSTSTFSESTESLTLSSQASVTNTTSISSEDSMMRTNPSSLSSTELNGETLSTQQSFQTSMFSTPLSTSTQGQSTSFQGGSAIPSLIEVRYDENYDLTLNGVIIGTYYVTGNQGLFNADNLNTLVIEFNSNYSPSDGEIVLLFADVPQDHVLEWENVEFVGGGECFTSEGVFIEETSGDDYGLLFETRSEDCELAIEASRLAPLATLLATN